MSIDPTTAWSIASVVAAFLMAVLVTLVVRRFRGRRARSGAGEAALGGIVALGGIERRGLVGRVLDVLDASVAMYLMRRGLGRSTVTRRERAELLAEERATAALALRIGAERPAGAPVPAGPRWIVVAGSDREERQAAGQPTFGVAATTVTGATATTTARRPSKEASGDRASSPSGPRARLARDTAVALAGVAVLVIVVTGLAPRPDGAVLDAVGTPPAIIPPGVTADPSGVAALPSGGPNAGATPAAPIPASLEPAAATPAPTARATPRPIATPRATPRPTATPRATLKPVVTPKPTAARTPTPILFVSFTCAVDDTTVTCDGSSSVGATTWAWAFEGGGTASGVVAVHTFPGVGDYAVTLTITGAAGMADDTIRVRIP